MQRLKLAASKIPIELMERLTRFTESTGLTQSAAIRQAIELFLDKHESTGFTELTAIEGSLTPSQLLPTVDAVNSRLTEIEARLERLESQSVTHTVKPTVKPIAGAMTVGGLFTALKPDYPHSQVTLAKHVNGSRATEKLPDDLMRLGVVADWQTRAAASNFNNQCRWLMLEQADRHS